LTSDVDKVTFNVEGSAARAQVHRVACEARLDHITATINAELSKTHRQRKWRLLNLLYKERAVYAFAVALLRDIDGTNPYPPSTYLGMSGRANEEVLALRRSG
jgi:hypothetical protein